MPQFSEPKINKKYRILAETDCNITVSKPFPYSGKLSNCNSPAILDAMIERGSNLVERIETKPKEKPDAEIKD